MRSPTAWRLLVSGKSFFVENSRVVSKRVSEALREAGGGSGGVGGGGGGGPRRVVPLRVVVPVRVMDISWWKWSWMVPS